MHLRTLVFILHSFSSQEKELSVDKNNYNTYISMQLAF